MRLKNKKTGEIVEAHEIDLIDNYVYLKIFRAGDYDTKQYTSLAELNEEWEDYDEPKKYYYINDIGAVQREDVGKCGIDELVRKEIGNYFETEEEAEKAVEKLEAWKRLKDKGFEFEGIREDYTKFSGSHLPFRDGMRYLHFNKSEDDEWMKENWDDLALLFGGGE